MSRIYHNSSEIYEDDLDDYSRDYDNDDNDNEYRTTNVTRSNSNPLNSVSSRSTQSSSSNNSSSSKSTQQLQPLVPMMQQPDTPEPAPFIKPVGKDIKTSQLSKNYTTVTMKSVPPRVHTSQLLANDFTNNNMYVKRNIGPKKFVNQRQFQSINKNKHINFIFDNTTLSVVTIGDYIYNIGNMLGKSRSLIFDIESSNTNIRTPLCIKIAVHDDIVFTNKQLQYINNNTDDFIEVYYYSSDVIFNQNLILNGVDLGNRIDICILEKIDTTLDKLCEKLLKYNSSIKTFSVKFLSCLTARLINIISRLNSYGFYYTDIKAENIGIAIYNNNLIVKLIDADTVDTIAKLATAQTSGRISPNISTIRMQYLNLFFTIISLLFLNQDSTMCSSNYDKFYYQDAVHNYMSWFGNNRNESFENCLQYKYALLIGTYKIIENFFGSNGFTANDIYYSYGYILVNVCDVITNKGRCVLTENGCSVVADRPEYFMFIAHCLVIMVAIFLCEQQDVINVVGKMFFDFYTIDDSTFISEDDFYAYVMLDAETPIGVSIVNSLRKYAVSYCNDKTCSALKAYGEYFLNIDN